MKVVPVATEDHGKQAVVRPREAVITTAGFTRTFGRLKDVQAKPDVGEGTPYTVRRGDSLWRICRRHIEQRGTPASAAEVHEAVLKVTRANRLANPDRIDVGQRLDLASVTRRRQPMVVTGQKMRIPSAPSQGGPGLAAVKTAPPLIAHDPVIQSARVRSHASYSLKRAAGMKDLFQAVAAHRTNRQEAAQTTNPWQRILGGKARLTSAFGMRRDPFTGRRQHHNGVDVAATTGTKIFPFKSGEVVFSGWKGGYGNMVIVEHGDGTETYYGHNSKNLVKPGQRVGTDTPLGLVGSTGRSTGPHIHFEVRKNGRAVDPIPLLAPKSFDIAKGF